MRELDTLQEQRNLIEKLVKSNNKFSGNEDLFEDFCSETFKRSYSLFENLEIERLESYISKVANTAILTVLKESGRIRRRSSQYVSTNEIPVSPVIPQQQVKVENVQAVESVEPVHVAKVQYENIKSCVESSLIYDIADPCDSFEEKIVRKDLLQKVVDVVLVAQKTHPEKEFLKIFYLRYLKEMKQKDIAKIVNISQGEVSKRLLEIADIVKSHFNG